MKKQKQAFTLIELLVVIAIIGILASIAVVSLQQSRRNARDVKRLADVKEIRTALELYFSENFSYPESIEGGIADEDTIYLDTIPTAPTPVDGNCSAESNQYVYHREKGSFYILSFCLGGQTEGMSDGSKCATPEGIFDGHNYQCFSCEKELLYEGHLYATAEIGDQCWFAENLRYLPEVHSNSQFQSQGSNNLPGYGVYGYDGSVLEDAKNTDNYDIYGALYNQYAVNTGDLCPEGWHVPSSADWNVLKDWLTGNGHSEAEGLALKAINPLWDGNDNFNFTALPGGWRGNTGSFADIGSRARFWMSDNMSRFQLSSSNNAISFTITVSSAGLSVRCLRSEDN
jgi:uncharacterized protein (TIGR02145 family)/prepilin-type N-terminal cleavage/methylation domain-containing protein